VHDQPAAGVHEVARHALHVLSKPDFEGAGRQHVQRRRRSVLDHQSGLVGFRDYSGEAIEVLEDGLWVMTGLYGRGSAESATFWSSWRR
jgi:hypothetical protein